MNLKFSAFTENQYLTLDGLIDMTCLTYEDKPRKAIKAHILTSKSCNLCDEGLKPKTFIPSDR